MATANLILSDGLVFSGQILHSGEDILVGEAVFSTSTTGYPEIMSDPSYFGQIVVMAQPEVGNYGVNMSDFQSSSIKITALVIRNLTTHPSSFRSQMTLIDWCLKENVPILYGVDTRALIRHLRTRGSMMAGLGVDSFDLPTLHDMVLKAPSMAGRRLSHHVGVQASRVVHDRGLGEGTHVVVMDFGVKQGIVDRLAEKASKITLVPSHMAPEEIFKLKPHGLLLSNGPGDPSLEHTAIQTVACCLGKLPIFGICLGHQILCQSLNMSTYKMPFGHRGSNQPVKLPDQKIWITAQNHGFAVALDDACGGEAYTNICDATSEGVVLDDIGAFSVQFHPEGAPGPRDALPLFDKFFSMMEGWAHKGSAEGTPWAQTRNNLGLLSP
jgi:carbamoyl-phosphate synthase small subunit